MAKLLISVGCTYTGDLVGSDIIKELESGGFEVVSGHYPHYQAVHEFDNNHEQSEALIALVQMRHHETIQDLTEVVRNTLKTGQFDLRSIDFNIREQVTSLK
ncbi:hypothetical protein [Bacillus licheniformis]|uniref:hypothetical protein n=1 Tax=Bacillus licheniformis TaxID=1402 RepID=UPI000B8A9F2B|nr:hypothetical protein [Bacillus licheniformis]MED0689936.1 hypothetical protein [Bacillus licheniformis]MED0713606.1 hypothetical protein [Bacillus licheniformis]MED0789277.1 hypothetical protein [Bacillus licheniformis]TWM10473.1 hypothetical protein CHCC15091_0970 [Bacillus licheniformis]WIW99359.1 hypothetical protein QQ984_03505 [Bacillus licheniformis]